MLAVFTAARSATQRFGERQGFTVNRCHRLIALQPQQLNQLPSPEPIVLIPDAQRTRPADSAGRSRLNQSQYDAHLFPGVATGDFLIHGEGRDRARPSSRGWCDVVTAPVATDCEGVPLQKRPQNINHAGRHFAGSVSDIQRVATDTSK